MVFHGLLTEGRLLEARHETQDLSGDFDKKTFTFTLPDIFSHIFSLILKSMKYFAKDA